MTVRFSVNGRQVTVPEGTPPSTTLLTFLRDTLRLIGTKNGCAQGHCGACTVIFNGKAQRACLMRLDRLEGARIETIEGLSAAGTMHPLQQSFVDEGAIQCGFCTPGMIMAAKALLDVNASPTDEDIRAALSNNLCRCTGYAGILRAIHRAAEVLRGGQPPVSPEALPRSAWNVVGRSMPRVDAVAKATGALHYADDLYEEGMLHAVALRSEYAHAEVLSIDTTEAARSPGVVAVLTARDVPGRNLFGLIRVDQPVLAADRVRYLGDPVAVVYAESLAQARESLSKIRVQYRELEIIATPQRALEPGAPVLHEGGNVLADLHMSKGDIEGGFRQADVIVENDYFTPFIEHAYLEPEAGLSLPTAGGGVEVRVGSQGPYVDRSEISAALGLPEDKVRVVHMPMGGAFGGKEDNTVQILSALGALRTGRPVKMVLPRPESLRVSTKRHAEYLHYKTGAKADGTLTAMQVSILLDTGAYASAGQAVILRSTAFSCGPYAVPNVKVDSYCVYTNNAPGGAMRGYGAPQVAFASECQMDELARRLGMDPFELRLKNGLEVGDRTASGHRVTESVGMKDTLRAVRDALRAWPVPRSGPGKRIGIGIASAYKNVGLGPGLDDKAGATAELDAEGHLIVRNGCIEMGQGQDTTMAQIAAHELQVPYELVRVYAGDTDTCPDSFMTTASRATLVQGRAVQMAAEKLRDMLLDLAAQELQIPRDRLSWKTGQATDAASGQRLGLAELSQAAARRGVTLKSHATYIAPPCYRNLEVDAELLAGDPDKLRLHIAYCFATQAAVVEVDEATGGVRVLKVIGASDVGKAINPLAIRGQIEGGVMMGLGYALQEEYRTEGNKIITDTLRKCKVPGIHQAPEVTALIIEDAHSLGPFGAKGMAELPAAPTAPAISNAIYDAVGVRLRALPMTPERILAALRAAGK